MALQADLTLAGETQGNIEGENTQDQGRENTIVIIGFSHSINSPRDVAHGQATGKRQHKPITLTKEFDKSSPLLYQVLATNETINVFKLRFWRPSRKGAEEHYFTIELEDATISEIRAEQLNSRYADNRVHREREHVSFTYRRITWTYEIGGITAMDDWNITG